MLKLVLFDFDGVLVDSLVVYEETVASCLAAIGSDVVKTREDFLALFDDNFYEALSLRGVDLLAFAEKSEPILGAIDVRRIIPWDEVIASVRAVGKDVVIISSNSAAAIAAILEHWCVGAFCQEVLGSEFLHSKKEKIAYAMEKFGAKKDETIYIGDTVGDIKEARLAGVKVMAVTWGWHEKKCLAMARPDFLVDTPAAMLSVLQGEG
ncbi:MAG: HAD hydrolase-like protein [Deltaproteobacteria bacterium]|nr:HAD hydrolase-like protein [Deltaproteobacteria bacterium]